MISPLRVLVAASILQAALSALYGGWVQIAGFAVAAVMLLLAALLYIDARDLTGD